MNRLNGSQQKMNTPTTASIILIICERKQTQEIISMLIEIRGRFAGYELQQIEQNARICSCFVTDRLSMLA